MDPVQSDLNTQDQGRVPREVCLVLEERADPLEVTSAPRTTPRQRQREKRTPLRSRTRSRRREEPSLGLSDIWRLSSGGGPVVVAVEKGNEEGTKIGFGLGFATRRTRQKVR